MRYLHVHRHASPAWVQHDTTVTLQQHHTQPVSVQPTVQAHKAREKRTHLQQAGGVRHTTGRLGGLL